MFLKQSTSVVINFGPFVDKADAVTLKTGLVSALDNGSTGIMLSKNGGTFAVRHATVTATTYDAHGNYKVTLDTTDTNTLGILRVIYEDATTILPVWQDYHVVSAAVYALLNDGTDVDTYQCKVWLFDDNTGTTDRYAVAYFKNGQPITTGITSPTIQIIKASDGTDLIASTALTQIASLGLYKYDATTTARITSGPAYMAKIQATIDGATRTWYQPVGRDS